jgi:hypothetical protein
MMLLHHVLRDNDFKGNLVTTVAYFTPPDMCVAMKNAVYERQSSHSPLTESPSANFIRNIPPNELSHVFANEVRCVDACLQARGTL